MSRLRIVVTGGDGFVGRNLRVRLHELGHDSVASLGRDVAIEERRSAIASADIVYHLAGVNRPKDVTEFDTGNRGVTVELCDELRRTGRPVPLVFTSSVQAELDNPYGVSKRAAELEVERYGADTGARVHVLRLTNVFGKWCRPDYNSAVATFCHNIARGLPITVRDPSAPLRLVYVDDVVDTLIDLLPPGGITDHAAEVRPVYSTTVGEVAASIRAFAESRNTRVTPRVGTGFTRALYATYLSYLPADAFSYSLIKHADARGVFAEMLKTPDCGQFSFFTAHPGITRGGHYHHTKNEKFLVVKGQARFRFRQIVTGDVHEIVVSDAAAQVVETVPGWAHDITNIGDEELVVMLWANEIFDPEKPDTVTAAVAG